MAWSSPLRMICVGVISGFVVSSASLVGFYFWLFDVAVTEAQQTGYRRPGSLQLKPEGVFISRVEARQIQGSSLAEAVGGKLQYTLLYSCAMYSCTVSQ